MAMEIGEVMARIIEETIIDRIVIKCIEVGVQVKIMVDPGQDIGITHGITQVQEIDMAMIEIKSETDPTLVTGKIVEQGLDQAHM